MTEPRQILLDRLRLTLPAGVDAPAFRRALVTELGRLDLSGVQPGRLDRLTLPPLHACPGDSATTLAARTVRALSETLGGRGR